MTQKTKQTKLKQCPYCLAFFDARAITQHRRACKEKHETPQTIKTEPEVKSSQEQTPQIQTKTSQNPSEKLKTVLIIPLILVLLLMKLILSIILQTKQAKEPPQNEPEITKSRYLINR